MTHLFEKMGLPSNIVYIRAVDRKEVPIDILEDLEDGKPVFAVFAEDGKQIALVEDQSVAYALAEEHQFSLHSVH